MDYGQYFIGSEQKAAYALFDQLQGESILHDHAVLHIDLMETENEVPVNIKSKCCTLEQLSRNCKQISREVFRLRNMKEVA